ncbi:hypothetical protein A5844_001763 [Enterococcus sp. 10A9_DIV0425]|uniref:Uncharacterized protein n=1 Tax=Candidatus Enterococcus wittei TaxID=1987383 RepID=A0A242JXM3_9ENTE|nr:hypothetical protein [Enterococcus sp. 10A9_DIV0425]OTP10066.1 hypothetical protein A5844_001763 [Enterococcus sp. 10A9_DIV0425]
MAGEYDRCTSYQQNNEKELGYDVSMERTIQQMQSILKQPD